MLAFRLSSSLQFNRLKVAQIIIFASWAFKVKPSSINNHLVYQVTTFTARANPMRYSSGYYPHNSPPYYNGFLLNASSMCSVMPLQRLHAATEFGFIRYTLSLPSCSCFLRNWSLFFFNDVLITADNSAYSIATLAVSRATIALAINVAAPSAPCSLFSSSVYLVHLIVL